MLTMLEDITARKRGEDGARRDEAMLVSLVKNAPFGVYAIDSDFRLRVINSGARAVFSGIEPLIGRDFAEILRVIWPEPFATEAIDHFRHTLATGQSYLAPTVTKARHNVDVTKSYDWQIHRITLPDGSHGVVCYFYDLTHQKQLEAAVRRTAERDAFRLNLADALRPLNDAVEVQAVAARVLGEHLGVSRAFYVEVETQEDGEYFRIRRDYCAPGVPSAAGRFRADDFGATLFGELRAGRTLPVASVETEPRLADQERESYLALGIGAYVSAPLIKGGRLVAVFGVHQIVPRAWMQAEIALIEETAERTWAEVERARAEEALRASEERLRLATVAAHVYSWEFDARTQRYSFSDNAARILGLDPATLPATSGDVERAVHPDDLALLQQTFSRAFEEGEGFAVDFRSVKQTGEIIWLNVQTTMLKDATGHAVRLLGIAQDITSRKRAEEALRESEARQTTILETMAEGVVTLDLQNRFVSANAAAGRILGVSRAELVGRSAAEPPFRRVTLDGAPRESRPTLAEVEAGGDRVFHDDYVIERRDGSRVVITRNLAAIRNRDGACTGFVATVADITARKQAEERLRSLQRVTASFAEALDLAQVRQVILSEVLSALKADSGGLRRVTAAGLVPDDYDLGNFVSEEIARRFAVVALGAQHPAADAARTREAVFVRDAGACLARYPNLAEAVNQNHTQANAHLPLMRGEEAFGVLSLNFREPREWDAAERDFALALADRASVAYERARLFEAVRESEDQFRTLGENMPDPLWLSDDQGRPVYQNPAWQQFTGVTAAQLAASGWQPLNHPDDLPMLERVWRRANETGESFEVEARMRRGDGAYRWCINRTAPLKDRAGRVVRWIGTMTDIHDRKQAAEAIQVLNATLEQRVAERTEALLESQERLRKLSLHAERSREDERARIAREVHDELGGSLTGLKFTLVRVRSGRQSDDDLMGVVRDMAEQIDGLVRTVRRIASDLRPPLLDDLGLSPALEWQAHEFEKRTGIACRLDLPRREPELSHVQRTAVFRAFQESLTNVARHANATRVRATVTQEGRDLVLRVADDGIGISPDALRAGKSLGLVGMRERMREVSGDMDIAGEPGRGTTITIRVPAVDADG